MSDKIENKQTAHNQQENSLSNQALELLKAGALGGALGAGANALGLKKEAEAAAQGAVLGGLGALAGSNLGRAAAEAATAGAIGGAAAAGAAKLVK
jgi:hypothetical protein